MKVLYIICLIFTMFYNFLCLLSPGAFFAVTPVGKIKAEKVAKTTIEEKFLVEVEKDGKVRSFFKPFNYNVPLKVKEYPEIEFYAEIDCSTFKFFRTNYPEQLYDYIANRELKGLYKSSFGNNVRVIYMLPFSFNIENTDIIKDMTIKQTIDGIKLIDFKEYLRDTYIRILLSPEDIKSYEFNYVSMLEFMNLVKDRIGDIPVEVNYEHNDESVDFRIDGIEDVEQLKKQFDENLIID